MDRIIGFCMEADRLLGKASYIPVVSAFTGSLRAGYGMGLGLPAVVAAEVFVAIAIVARVVRGPVAAARFWRLSVQSGCIVLNGLLNAERGLIEAVPVFGNVVVWAYDKAMNGRVLIPYNPSFLSRFA